MNEVTKCDLKREDIIRMAKEASGHDFVGPRTIEFAERFAVLVAAAVLDRPRRDAERYRWLRGMIYDDQIIVAADRMLHGEALDAAVDAAMRQEQPR